MDTVKTHVENFGHLFYVVSHNSSSFNTTAEVPNYLNDIIPYLAVLIALEIGILLHQNKGIRVNNSINSVSHGIIFTFVTYTTAGVEFMGYDWLYQRRFFHLEWNSALTWWVAALTTDFMHYWNHRFQHEVMLGWAIHQVHHSSEDFTIMAGTRTSIFQKFLGAIFFFPCALVGVPLPAVLVHLQLNLIYQLWLHNEIITTLGPLEWIFNTPSHHRVHHGSDPWCLDKNYGGLLIIWDRIFGTFQPEKRDVQITYGLVSQPATFNILTHQFFYLELMLKRAASTKNWGEALKVIFYSPDYDPEIEENQTNNNIEEMKKQSLTEIVQTPREKYDPKLYPLMELYVIVNFATLLFFNQVIVDKYRSISWFSMLLHTSYLVISLTNIGAMYDGWKGARALEALRCAVFVAVSFVYSYTENPLVNSFMVGFSCFSAVLWTLSLVLPTPQIKLKLSNKVE